MSSMRKRSIVGGETTETSPSKQMQEEELNTIHMPENSDNESAVFEGTATSGAISKEETATVSTDDVIDSSQLEDALLRADGKGIFGCMERIPMGLKLLFMTVVAVAGVIAMGAFLLALSAQDYKNSSDLYDFVSHIERIGLLVQYIQQERVDTVLYLSVNTTENLESLLVTRAATDSYLLELATNPSVDNTTEALGNVLLYVTSLEARRNTFVGKTAVRAAFNFYTDFINSLIQYAYKMLSGKSTLNINNNALSLLVYLHYMEMFDVMSDYVGVILETHQMSFDTYSSFIQSKGKRDVLLQQWYTLNSLDIVNASRAATTGSRNITTIENSLVSAPNKPGFNFTSIAAIFTMDVDLDVWRTGYNAILRKNLGIVLALRDRLLTDKNVINDYATTILAIVLVILVVSFVAVVTCNLLFSRTIIGPWMRLNRMQELTIRRFVPKGFLRLVNAHKITDVKLGMNKERNITLVLIRINKFNELTQRMKDAEVFALVNRYLEFIGPIIRKNNGFIDKTIGEKLYVIFPAPKYGRNAVLNIQERMEAFNATALTGSAPLQLNIAIHHSKMVIGTIGEHERLEGVIFSKHVGLVEKLSDLASQAGIGILATRIVMHKGLNYRYLGHITQNMERVDLFEIISANLTDVMKTKDTFTNATNLLFRGQFDQALKLFTAIAEFLPKDPLTLNHTSLTQHMIHKRLRIKRELTISQTLQDPVLKAAFEQFCKKELSTENIGLWDAIHKYRVLSTLQERQAAAESILKTYLYTQAPSSVNIDIGLRNKFIAKAEQDYATLDSRVFDELELEMEVLMNDTMKRFRGDVLFTESFPRCSHYPKLSTICLSEH